VHIAGNFDKLLKMIHSKEDRNPRFHRRRWLYVAAGTTLILASALFLLCYVGYFGGNIREVVPGRFYRSGQLNRHQLDTFLSSHRIRTVINLRGGPFPAEWYSAEVTSCTMQHVRHIDVAFSATQLPPPAELEKLLYAFDHESFPMLVHCQGGADRSGLASVLFLHLFEGVPLEQALSKQLTWRYGHLRWGPARAMDDFFALYSHSRQSLCLREWIHKTYPLLYASRRRQP
jgi:hypothetical protein